jgi:signal transduction histidine kinase
MNIKQFQPKNNVRFIPPRLILITPFVVQIFEVECYQGHLNQVFMNILSNAIDALEETNQGKTFGSFLNFL